jgi:hypothetical protein
MLTERSSPAEPVTSYLAGGRTREVRVQRDAAGRWQILDIGPHGAVAVDTLTGYDDRLSQARAVAVDYARQRAAFLRGERDDDPYPTTPIQRRARRPVE